MAKGTIALGQFRGKVGGQVMRVVDGKQVMQNYQPIVRNPRTDAQERQRAAIRKLGQLSRELLSVIRTSYKRPYGAAQFIKSNISRLAGALSVDAEMDVQVNYAALKITDESAGDLIYAAPGVIDYGEAVHLRVKVPIAAMQIAPTINSDNVRVYAVVYCPDRNMAVMGAGVNADASEALVDVPENFDGMEVHVWLFATAATGEIDPDAFNQTSLRLPTINSRAAYGGYGEVA